MKRILLGLLLAASTQLCYAQYAYWVLGAYSYTETTDITSVRSTFAVVKAGGKSQKSVWMAAQVGDRWVQAGYQNGGKQPKYIVMCWSLVGGTWTDGCPGTAYIAHPTMTPGNFTSITVINVPGTTRWQVVVDGILASDFDMGLDYARSGQINIEQAPSLSPERFPTILASPAIEFARADGVWFYAPWGKASYHYSTEWGVEGQLQNPGLAPNEVRLGSAIPSVPGGTTLWGAP